VIQPSDRLDSWKAISEYLGRDVRTLQRWEQLGLPIRRMPGGRGHSVFALRSEIDAWMLRGGANGDSREVNAVAAPSRPSGSARRGWVAILPVAALALVGWWVRPGSMAAEPLIVDVTESGVVATTSQGADRWRWNFPEGQLAVLDAPHVTGDVIGGGDPSVLVRTVHGLDRLSHKASSGVLRQFSLDGQLQRAFSFTDQWLFADPRPFGKPWAMTAAQAGNLGEYDAYRRGCASFHLVARRGHGAGRTLATPRLIR
jgi:hypothetical protein